MFKLMTPKTKVLLSMSTPILSKLVQSFIFKVLVPHKALTLDKNLSRPRIHHQMFPIIKYFTIFLKVN
jgi:hypothetical protein